MSHRVYIIVSMLLMAVVTRAQAPVRADSVRLARCGEHVQLTLAVTLDGGELPRRDVVVLTPRLVGAADSIDFPPIVVFGRNAYYHDVRQGTVTGEIPADAYRVRYKGVPRSEHYARTVAWQPWMEHSQLKLILQRGTPCDQRSLSVTTTDGFDVAPPDTTITWTTETQAQVATDTVKGEARIQFVVNKTEFNPSLATNRTELERIRASIDSVRTNPDITDTHYYIKGYASPEGPYANNVRLAKGRVECLRQYIINNWGVPPEQVDTADEPEDWGGMRNYVTAHRDDIANADDILRIIDGDDADPDHKLAVIEQRYPKSYRLLLQECFPALRRTEYIISYKRRQTVGHLSTLLADTIIRPGTGIEDVPLEPDVVTRVRPTRPWLALKTNMLFDLLLTPNVELEVPIGDRWSLMVEDWFPWLLHNKGGNISLGRYVKPGDDMKSSAYELWTIGAELRYWWPGACPEARPRLTGHFLGLYYANGKYDVEWDSKGDQGEFNSVGVTYGHSWPIARHWNLEASVSAGYFWGPRRHYEGEFGDTHLIWKYTGRTSYIGPTKLKLSLVWLIPSLKKQKGGAHE